MRQIFTKWVEAEVVAHITTKRVRHFYWINIICQFGLPRVILSYNGIQFASLFMVVFCRDFSIQNHFILVEHPQANSQAKATNKIILTWMKKKQDEAKGFWFEYLHKILWSYHTTPYSTTQEIHFRMVYRVDAMILVEINISTYRPFAFDKNISQEDLNTTTDLSTKVRETVHVRYFVAMHRLARRFNMKVKKQGFIQMTWF